MDPQTFSVHANKLVDIVGSASDANGPVALTNLSFTPETSTIGTKDSKDVDGDNLSVINTTGIVVGASDTVTFTADGANGKKYKAIATGTCVADDETFEPMALIFTEEAA